MVGESFHPRGCWGEDSDHIRLGATAPKAVAPFRFYEGNACGSRVIEARRAQFEIYFSQKVLDRIAIPTLYKEGCAIMRIAHREGNHSNVDELDT